MTYLEIDKFIVDITKEKYNDCKRRLDLIPKENSTERKAVQLELGMYNFCGNAGLLFTPNRENSLNTRLIVMNQLVPRYPSLNGVYSGLTESEKRIFVAALQAETFIRCTWLPEQLAELAHAKAASHTQNIFELNIKISSVNQMFAEWETWRIKNGVYPHMFDNAPKIQVQSTGDI